ncbi:MAG: DUF58 domain-containing protein [Pirellulales bacterium]
MSGISTPESPLLSPELLARLQCVELVTRKMFRGRMKGERRSPRKGQSVEFADFRNYAPGDDLRLVDWNSYARLERLFLKLFLEEEDLHFYPVIDASRSMEFGEPAKLRLACRLAAALGFVALLRSDRVKVAVLGGESPRGPAVFRGRRSLWRMLDHLSRIAPGRPVPLEQGLRDFALRNPGRGIVVLLSDLMDKNGYESALRYLATRQMDVYVLQILSAEELEPELAGDLRLVDCEDGDAAEISVSAPLLARYKKTLAAFVDGAREYCTRRGMGHAMVRSDAAVEDVVFGYLRRRGLIRRQ